MCKTCGNSCKEAVDKRLAPCCASCLICAEYLYLPLPLTNNTDLGGDNNT
jgi:hypothetical protein